MYYKCFISFHFKQLFLKVHFSGTVQLVQYYSVSYPIFKAATRGLCMLCSKAHYVASAVPWTSGCLRACLHVPAVADSLHMSPFIKQGCHFLRCKARTTRGTATSQDGSNYLKRTQRQLRLQSYTYIHTYLGVPQGNLLLRGYAGLSLKMPVGFQSQNESRASYLKIVTLIIGGKSISNTNCNTNLVTNTNHLQRCIL